MNRLIKSNELRKREDSHSRKANQVMVQHLNFIFCVNAAFFENFAIKHFLAKTTVLINSTVFLLDTTK